MYFHYRSRSSSCRMDWSDRKSRRLCQCSWYSWCTLWCRSTDLRHGYTVYEWILRKFKEADTNTE